MTQLRSKPSTYRLHITSKVSIRIENLWIDSIIFALHNYWVAIIWLYFYFISEYIQEIFNSKVDFVDSQKVGNDSEKPLLKKILI
jgi:hypothetical protein